MGYLIENVTIINEGESFKGSVSIYDDKIERVVKGEWKGEKSGYELIDGDGLLLIPGVIDDQVHFREPGLEYKGDISTETKAAVAGGVTSFMEMPNTKPATVSLELLEEKFGRAAEFSAANYSFYFGATNDNLNTIKRIDASRVCGVKVFMGSSTGNMLVDSEYALSGIFAESPVLVATHCEDEFTIRRNSQRYRNFYGDKLAIKYHAEIRSAEACYLSSNKAVSLARKYGTRLHVLHVSSGLETNLFDKGFDVKKKQITAEVCVHHLWFTADDYDVLGSRIKWNPSVKYLADREALWDALKDGRLDVVATDHAPHSLAEKQGGYFDVPSGAPMVQHSLVAMLELAKNGRLSKEAVVDKMCHKPAELFGIVDRGFIREGYKADLVLINPDNEWLVSKENILYKCAWSPMEGVKFSHKVLKTFVNGHLVYDNGVFDDNVYGEELKFDR